MPSRPPTIILNKSLPASSLATIGNAGLRRPSDRFALKSSYFSPSLNLLLVPHQKKNPASAAPRFSMRVASKQSYICRDCGYVTSLASFCSTALISFNLDLNVIWLIILQFYWCRYIYNDRTPFEKLSDKYFCPGKSFSPLPSAFRSSSISFYNYRSTYIWRNGSTVLYMLLLWQLLIL